MKHGERRRSGRKILTLDFEHLPPAAALAYDLNCPDYVAIVCGSLEQLHAAFAELDAKRRDAQRLGLPEAPSTREAAETDLVSASLPTADRRLVRSGAMGERVNTAARSRAPQTSKITSKKAG